MNVALISGSPKVKGSVSALYLDELAQRLSPDAHISQLSFCKNDYDAITASIADSEVMVIAFPLYVDCIPSHVLEFLDHFAGDTKRPSAKTTVYAICNCGFYEGEQTSNALSVMELWANVCGFTWGGAIGVGGGGMAGAARVGQGPAKEIGTAFDTLAEGITSGIPLNRQLIVNHSFPRSLYKMMGELGWKQLAKKNGLKPKDLYTKL